MQPFLYLDAQGGLGVYLRAANGRQAAFYYCINEFEAEIRIEYYPYIMNSIVMLTAIPPAHAKSLQLLQFTKFKENIKIIF